MNYALMTALASLWRAKWINLLCMLTLGTGLFFAASAAITLMAVEQAARELPKQFTLTAYLEKDLSRRANEEALQKIKAMPEVLEANLISSEEAFQDLKDAFKDSPGILEGLDENPLPPSVELKLKEPSVNDRAVRDLEDRLRGLSGVDEVEYGAEHLAMIESIRSYTKGVGAILLATLSLGMLFVMYATIKVFIHRRLQEIETQKLLGATKWFIRTPFLLEGGLLGAGGGAFAALGVGGLAGVLQGGMAVVPILGALKPPVGYAAALPLVGLALGITGALIAIGRIRY